MAIKASRFGSWNLVYAPRLWERHFWAVVVVVVDGDDGFYIARYSPFSSRLTAFACDSA